MSSVEKVNAPAVSEAPTVTPHPKPTTTETVILTVKVVGGAGLILAALWGLDRLL